MSEVNTLHPNLEHTHTHAHAMQSHAHHSPAASALSRGCRDPSGEASKRVADSLWLAGRLCASNIIDNVSECVFLFGVYTMICAPCPNTLSNSAWPHFPMTLRPDEDVLMHSLHTPLSNPLKFAGRPVCASGHRNEFAKYVCKRIYDNIINAFTTARIDLLLNVVESVVGV